MFETLFIIAEQALMHFPLILGAYISISLMKTPNLSLESAYVFGAILGSSAVFYVQNLPSLIGIIIVLCMSILGGACVGIVTSLLTRAINLPHLLASIITIGIFHGVNQLVAGVYISLSSFPNLLATTVSTLHPELPTLLIIFATLFLCTFYFFKTQLCYAFAVFGNNPRFFSHYGISTSYVFCSGIIVASALAGLSGYLFAQSNGFAEINMGFGKVLLCLAALILGKITNVTKKTLSLIVPIAGISAYFTLQQLLIKIGFNLKYFTMVQALVILTILIIQYRKQKKDITIDHLGV